jgi:hypothetical protein
MLTHLAYADDRLRRPPQTGSALQPGAALLAAGVLLHASGWRLAAWPLLVTGTVATALFLGNAGEFVRLHRWRRRRCPACGAPFRVDSITEVATTRVHTLSDGVCRHTAHHDLACPPADQSPTSTPPAGA